MQRRDFLAGTVATGAVWLFGGEMALGQIPWEDEHSAPKLADSEEYAIGGRQQLELSDGCAYPVIAALPMGNLAVAWHAERDGVEGLYTRRYTGGQWQPESQVSTKGRVILHPVMATAGDDAVLAWVEGDSIDHLRVAFHAPGRTVPPIDLEGPVMRPALVADRQGGLWLALEHLVEHRQSIRLYRLAPGASEWQSIAPAREGAGDQSRPAIAIGNAPGELWLVWDEAIGIGNLAVMLCRIMDGKAEAPRRVTNHPAHNVAPALAVEKDGTVWVAWHSNRRGESEWDMPRWVYLRGLRNGEWVMPEAGIPAPELEKEGTDQSLEFPRLLIGPGGQLIIAARPSHNFSLQVLHGTTWSPRHRIPVDGWGGRGKHLEAVFAPNGDLWIVRRDLNANIVNRVTGWSREVKAIPVVPDPDPINAPAVVTNLDRQQPWEPLTELEGIAEPQQFWYGDLHGHTWMSDGINDIDEYYLQRRDYLGDDFAALTDHDRFVGRAILPSEYEQQKLLAEHFNLTDNFVTFFAQEWTTGRIPKGAGHKCIYTLSREIPLLDHGKKPWDETKALYADIRRHGGIIVPHHTGWTGTDWENAEPDVQMLLEIISNHGRFEFMGNRPLPHRGGIKGMFAQDALAAGHRFGFIGGTDCHGLIWHHHAGHKRMGLRGGLAGVLAPRLNREAIFDALKARRCFATTGIKPRIDFRVANHVMGSEFTTDATELAVRVDIMARNDIKWATIVRNNEDWHEYGGEGYTTKFTIVDREPLKGTSFYYLRVEFEENEMAWSSPIWVTRG